jgi:hypothetical protein
MAIEAMKNKSIIFAEFKKFYHENAELSKLSVETFLKM